MQGEVIKVRGYNDDIEYAMKVVASDKMSNQIFANQIF